MFSSLQIGMGIIDKREEKDYEKTLPFIVLKHEREKS